MNLHETCHLTMAALSCLRRRQKKWKLSAWCTSHRPDLGRSHRTGAYHMSPQDLCRFVGQLDVYWSTYPSPCVGFMVWCTSCKYLRMSTYETYGDGSLPTAQKRCRWTSKQRLVRSFMECSLRVQGIDPPPYQCPNDPANMLQWYTNRWDTHCIGGFVFGLSDFIESCSTIPAIGAVAKEPA